MFIGVVKDPETEVAVAAAAASAAAGSCSRGSRSSPGSTGCRNPAGCAGAACSGRPGQSSASSSDSSQTRNRAGCWHRCQHPASGQTGKIMARITCCTNAEFANVLFAVHCRTQGFQQSLKKNLNNKNRALIWLWKSYICVWKIMKMPLTQKRVL